MTGTVGQAWPSDAAIDDVIFSQGCGAESQCSALAEKPVFGTSSGTGIYVGVIDEKLHVGLSGRPDLVSVADVAYLTWSHIAMQYDQDSGTQSLYINGQLNQTSSSLFSGAVFDESVSLSVGQNGSSVLDGAWIDEIQLWDIAVDVSLTYNRYLDADQTPNLIGYWKFDEGSGTLSVDETGRSDATLQADGPTWIASSLELEGG